MNSSNKNKGEAKILRILAFLKSELKNNYSDLDISEFKSSPDMPENYAYNFSFQNDQDLYIDIQYWDTGCMFGGAAKGKIEDIDDLLIDFEHVPDKLYEDNSSKFITFPKEAEEIFIQKINELLRILNKDNPNIKMNLPEELNK